MTAIRKVGEDTIVNVTTEGSQYGGAISTLSNGDYVISWIDGGGGSERAKARLFAANGAAITGEFEVGLSYEISALANGGFLVVAPGFTGVGQVRRYAADGTPDGAAIFTGSTRSLSQSAVGLIDGGFLFVETERGDNVADTDDWGVFAQRFDNTGAKVGNRFAVNSDVAGDQYLGRPVALSGGGFAIAWNTASPTADGSENAIRAQVYGASGQRVGGEIAVNTTSEGQQFTADVLALGDGGFAVHYNTNDPDPNGQGRNRSYVQRFDATGAKIGGERQLNGPADEFLRLSDGNLAHVYQILDTYEVFVQLFDAALNPVGEPFGFQGVSGFGSFSAAAAIEGGIVLTYSSPFNLDGSRSAVLTQRLELFETTNGTGRRDVLVAPNGNSWNANGGAGDDDLTGAGGNDRLVGGLGNDVMRGGDGNNRLSGGEGNDSLLANGVGRNILSGGAGNDRLRGGAGYEVMYGDAGTGRFLFTAAELANPQGKLDARIADFARADGDRIDLSAIDAIAGGDNDAFIFIGTSAFSGTGGEVRLFEENGLRYLHGDTNGDGLVELVVRVDGDAPTAADFIL